MRKLANEGKTVFFSTHILEVAEKICDRIGIINDGKIVVLEENKEKNKESLEKIFMEIIENEY